MAGMRCPHCASPRVDKEVCLVCGGVLSKPAEQPRLAGLEPTRKEQVSVEAARMPDLETTEEVLGDVKIRGDSMPAQGKGGEAWRKCSQCAARSPPGRSLCLACGKRL
ncbi:MAG: hypothetical protein HYZ27_09550 [Deltaproteobacteria bacterium]|nr:hypothetical protein [Deltaproteobacteria bacterium]